MKENSDHRLKERLSALRASRLEQLANQQAMTLFDTEAREQDTVSIEKAIIDAALTLRSKMIDIQAKQVKRRQATRLGRWLFSRHSIPEIRFGFDEHNGVRWDAPDMTVATAPLITTKEETPNGKIVYGWVFELKSPTPEVMTWSGNKNPPIHAWGRYEQSPIDIYRVAEDKSTDLQTREKWFTIYPEVDDISCWKLGDQRRDFFIALEIESALKEDEQVTAHIDEKSDSTEVEFQRLGPESEERERRRTQLNFERLKAQYAPDLETGLQLLGLIRGASNELG